MKKIILVVDDDKANLMIAQRLLTEEYRVAAVNSGQLAIHYLGKNTPDLILLDIQMPEMDGFEVMRRIQQNGEWCRIPVIFLTADRSEKTEEACFKMGAVDYIGKPFVPAIMLQRVRRTLELEDYRKNLEKMVQQQLQQITQLLQDIIMTMANLIESRDGTTGEHVKRTSIYTRFLIQQLQKKGLYKAELTPAFVDYLCKAAPLHDIGKIMVSDSILQKTGSLTAEEYDCIKLHAEEGGRLIRENMSRIVNKEFVDIASDVAAYHHEMWNGGGYPEGLEEMQIPLAARILTIADVFDALTAKRPYKEGMSMAQALSIMEEKRGESFEPSLIDAFLEAKDELQLLVDELQKGEE